jgi:hypothetical protein
MTNPTQAHARNTDPQTSHDAAASVRVTAGQREVLEIFELLHRATDENVARKHEARCLLGTAYASLSPSGLRTRRSELVRLGKIRDSGVRWTMASGRKAVVWEVCDV